MMIKALIISFIKNLAAKFFLIIPVTFTFALIEIFLNTQLNTGLVQSLGLADILFNDPNRSYDEKELFTFLMSVWFGITLITQIFDSIFKLKFKLDRVLINGTVHFLNFLLLSYMLIEDGTSILTSLLVSLFLCLISFGSAKIYIAVDSYLSATHIRTKSEAVIKEK